MKTIILSAFLSIICFSVICQNIPTDSMYLSQVPPGNIPKIFNLSKSTGSFTAERIAISNDGKEIYYTAIRSYYPTAGDTIKYYKYSENKWQGPFNLFSNHLAPAFSVTGDTMYLQNNSMIYQTLTSYRISNSWSEPKRILYGINNAHYLQVTNNGHYYISSSSGAGLGATDWCRLFINGADTAAISLRLPLNSSADNLDFFVARDETYMIIAKFQDLWISYHKNDNTWTNPKNLGQAINFGAAAWGPYVTHDNKFLFFTTGSNPNYSDTYIYWVKIDNIVDSLMHTNFVPYLKNQIPNQTDTSGTYYEYTVPDSTFIDDDGNNSLTYTAALDNGLPLPGWLNFDPVTRKFSGIVSSNNYINIKVNATDTANSSAYCIFTLNIVQQIGIEPVNGYLPSKFSLQQNYPNPFNPLTAINFDIAEKSMTILKIYDITGKEVFTLVNEELRSGKYKVNLYADKLSSGVYFYILKAGGFVQSRKMILIK